MLQTYVKIFLYKEDFDKFVEGISEVIDYIRSGHFPDKSIEETTKNSSDEFSDVNFDDLNSSPSDIS